MTLNFNDAMQANLGFVAAQTTHVEAGVYRIRRPDIQYPELIPVDTSANPWATSVTYYSQDQFGKADWVNGKARDIPLASTRREKFNTAVHMAGIGYSYSLEEVQQAQMLGINLPSEDAMAATRAYDEMVERIAFTGDTTKGFIGLFNNLTVPVVVASGTFQTLTADQVLAYLNGLITKVRVNTNSVALSDTILLPFTSYDYIATTPRATGSDMTILAFFLKNNVYTLQTGRPLTVRGVLGLDTAGAGGTRRAVGYRRSPEVLKLHIPMPHRFLPVQIIMLEYIVPGIFRLGGLDIRLPSEINYLDGI